MNKELIGPKLETLDNKEIENIFLEPKNKEDSIVLDDAFPNNGVQTQNLNLNDLLKIKKEKVRSPKTDSKKKSGNKKRNVFYENISNKFSQNIQKKILNSLYFLGKSRRLALKIKKMFFYRNFDNLTKTQKLMLNDKTDFSWLPSKTNSIIVKYYFFLIFFIK